MLIKADEDARYGKVMEAMDELRAAGSRTWASSPSVARGRWRGGGN